MRLIELDMSPQRMRLTPEEMEFVLDLVKDEIMTQSELSAKVKDATVDYSRNKNSLRMAAPRIYTLVHGELPLDMEDRAGWFAEMPNTMIRFLQSKGYDVADNIRRAKIDARHRTKKPTRQQAKDIMISYFNDHEEHLDRDAVVKNREKIQRQIQQGDHIELVFRPFYLDESVFESIIDQKGLQHLL
jgi:hypothetical protein